MSRNLCREAVHGNGQDALLGLSALPPALSRSLLVWWERHGRRDLAQKPWMFMPSGDWPQGQDELDPDPSWISEVMRCSAASR